APRGRRVPASALGHFLSRHARLGSAGGSAVPARTAAAAHAPGRRADRAGARREGSALVARGGRGGCAAGEREAGKAGQHAAVSHGLMIRCCWTAERSYSRSPQKSCSLSRVETRSTGYHQAMRITGVSDGLFALICVSSLIVRSFL